MIPKIIHYCWFGRGIIPAEIQAYIDGWHKHCPDYRFMLWNEDNFDVGCMDYVREAYAMRNYAFVSDVCRLHALARYGGIYLDTDVELRKAPTEEMLACNSFVGTEGDGICGMGVIGAEPDTIWINRFIDYYSSHHFINPFGHPDRTPNPLLFKRLVCPCLSATQMPVILLPPIICTPSVEGHYIDSETVAVHHFAASWRPRKTFATRVMTIFKGLGVRYFGKGS